MIQDPIVLDKSSRVEDALKIMKENKIGGIPVVDDENKLGVDIILRTESLKKDFERFCAEQNIQADLPWANRSETNLHVQNLYNKSTWEVIRDRYEEDISYFGYK